MKVNLKKSIQESVLKYMKDNDIEAEEIEAVELTPSEIKRGEKEGSIDTYFGRGEIMGIGNTWRTGYLAIPINGKVIPVKEIP